MAENNKINDWEEVPVEDWQEVTETPVAPESISSLDAGLEGVSQGATFGFAEEITAPVVAGIGMAQGLPQESGESKMQQFQRLMQTYRDVARDKTKLAEEQRPVEFGAGSLVGGLAIPGAAAASGTGLVSKLAQGAVTGAIGGAATGLGVAEGTLEERIPAALEMAQTGAVIGTAIPGGVAAVKGIKAGGKAIAKVVKESDVGKIFKSYQQGEDLLSDVVKNYQGLKDLGGEVTSELANKYKNLSKDLDAEFKKLSDNGVLVDIKPILEQRRKELLALSESQNPDISKNARKVLDVVDNYMYGKEQVKLVPKISPQEKQLKDYKALLEKRNKLEIKKLQKGLTDQEEVALNKLEQKKAKTEAVEGSEALNEPNIYASDEGKRVLTQDMGVNIGGELQSRTLSQNIQDMNLTPISESIDPKTGARILSFKDEASGQVFSEAVPADLNISTDLKPIKVRSGEKTKLTPKELQDAEAALKEFTPVGAGMSLPPSVSKASSGIVKDIRELRPDSVKDILKSQSDLRSKYESLAGKEIPDVLSPSEQEASREQLAKLLMQFDPEMMKKGKLPDIMEGFKSIKDQKDIPGLKSVAPELAKKLEAEAPAIAEKIRLGLKLDPNELKTISPDVRAQVAATVGGGAGLISKGAAFAGKKAKSIGESTRAFVEKDPAYLGSIATKVKELGGVGVDLSNVLLKAVDKEPRARNAILYSVMQNPAYREMIRSVEGEETSGEQ